MRTANKNVRILAWILSATAILLLAACGSAANDATPTVSIDAVFTSAYETFSAQQATQLALTPPTSTPAPTLIPTLPPPSPFATISFNSPTPNTGGTLCDNSTFVTDVTIPDDTTMAPGAGFVKTWKLLNSGTCTWNISYKIAFASGDLMGGVAASVAVPVPPGNQADLSVKLVAPAANGTYKGFWRMQNDKSQPFGNSPWVEIKVSGGSTATAGASPTAGPTPTAGAGTFTISGNAGAPEVILSYTDGVVKNVTADSTGQYSITVPAGWSGTVTPHKGSYAFNPTEVTYTNVLANLTGQNYVATP